MLADFTAVRGDDRSDSHPWGLVDHVVDAMSVEQNDRGGRAWS